jgi:hypothetical protein
MLLVGGIMDLRAMSVVTAAITVEHLAPAGERVARHQGHPDRGRAVADRASGRARMRDPQWCAGTSHGVSLRPSKPARNRPLLDARPVIREFSGAAW